MKRSRRSKSLTLPRFWTLARAAPSLTAATLALSACSSGDSESQPKSVAADAGNDAATSDDGSPPPTCKTDWGLLHDPKNCGTCGTICESGAPCSNGVCGNPAEVVSSQPAYDFAVLESEVFFVNGTGVYRTDASFSAPVQLSDVGGDMLAVNSNHLYVGFVGSAFDTTGSVTRVDRITGQSMVIADEQQRLRALLLGEDHVYWADDDKVMRWSITQEVQEVFAEVAGARSLLEADGKLYVGLGTVSNGAFGSGSVLQLSGDGSPPDYALPPRAGFLAKALALSGTESLWAVDAEAGLARQLVLAEDRDASLQMFSNSQVTSNEARSARVQVVGDTLVVSGGRPNIAGVFAISTNDSAFTVIFPLEAHGLAVLGDSIFFGSKDEIRKATLPQ